MSETSCDSCVNSAPQLSQPCPLCFTAFHHQLIIEELEDRFQKAVRPNVETLRGVNIVQAALFGNFYSAIGCGYADEALDAIEQLTRERYNELRDVPSPYTKEQMELHLNRLRISIAPYMPVMTQIVMFEPGAVSAAVEKQVYHFQFENDEEAHTVELRDDREALAFVTLTTVRCWKLGAEGKKVQIWPTAQDAEPDSKLAKHIHAD